MVTKIKLTQQFVNATACPPDQAEAVWHDKELPGMKLRVQRSGAKSYTIRYRAGGRGAQQRRLTLDARKIPLGELAPLEVAEQVSDRGSSNFTVWHVVRSKPRVRVNSNCSEGWHGVHLIQSTRCAPARRRGPACDSEGRRCPSRR